MKGKQKGIYQPPTSGVVEMKMQGVLCESVYDIWFMNPGGDAWGRSAYSDGTGDGITWD